MSNLVRQGELDIGKVLAGNTVEEIDIDAIALNTFQILVTLTPRVLTLIDYIRNGGTVPPIHVEAHKTFYKLLDGHNRYIVYKLLGKKRIEVYYDPGSGGQ